MKKVFLFSLITLSLSSAKFIKAEENSNNFNYTISADIRSIHTWRGGLSTNTLNVQPALYMGNNNIFGGAWSCYSENGKFAEVDLYLGYSLKNFTLTLLDYYCPDMINGGNNNFLEIDKEDSRHIVDVNLSYQLNRIPLSFMFSTLIFGDYESRDKDNRYSSYLEAKYNLALKNWKFNFFVGTTPYKGMYAKEAAIVNSGVMAIYTIKIGEKFHLPVYCSTIVNPYKDKGYLLIGTTIALSK